MKNIFRLLMAALVICATSCTKEDVSSTVVGNGEVVEVNFSANLSELGTRVTTGSGAAADRLQVNVFDAANGNQLTELSRTDTRNSKDESFNFSLPLVKGMTYDIVLWADMGDNSIYTLNGKVVTANYSAVKSNDENLDAFCFVFKGFDPTNPAHSPHFTLRRPFAQLNAATNDKADVAASGIELTTSEVKVLAYNQFDIFEGTVPQGATKAEVTFGAANIPGGDLNGNATYEYLSANYLFVPATGALTDAVYTFKGKKTNGYVVTFKGTSYSAIPLKPNHRTNILGALLTKPADFVVDIEADFNKADQVVATDAAAAQTALDNAVSGDKIQLQPGVNYGTLIFRKTASSTVVDITDAGGDAAGNEKYRRIEDLTIIGAEGAIVDGFDFQVGWISGSGASYIDIKNLTVKNVTFSGNMTPFKFEGFALGIDGLNIVDCKMNDADNNDRFVFQQMNGYKVLNDKSTNEYVMKSGIKNLTITGCEITGAYQVIESRAMENLAITNNTFRGIKARDMLITSDVKNFPDKTYTGYVTVTGNQSFDGEERFVRASLNNSDAVVLIKDNNIYNYQGADADYIKVEGGNNVTIQNNVCGKFVYGLTLIPNGENSKIFVNDKEGFLNLTKLFADWTRLFTDGNGNEWGNYANGAGADYYYRDHWTISLEADIDLNNDTIDPVILKHPVSTGVLTFDGNNNTIKNAIIVTDATTENAAGLFDASHYDALKNLRLDNIHVTGSNIGNSSAGVLSGSVSADVQNITITNSSVTGGKYTGGIIGNGYTDVTNCSLTNVTVKGGYKLGGVIGYICASSGTGDVTGNTLTDCTVDGIGGGVYAGGKSEYIIGKVVGNYNCNGVCSNNTITNMTTSTTANIGKIETGFTVQQ